MAKSASNAVRLDALAAISGVMIALQARANGELSYRLDNAPQAALVSFSSGLFFVALYARSESTRLNSSHEIPSRMPSSA